MVNEMQSKLNALPMREASEFIVESAVNMISSLKKQLYDYKEEKKRYEEDYLIAIRDGDLRENSLLEESSKNIKITTGNIIKTEKKLRGLDRIQDRRFRKKSFDMTQFYNMSRSLSQDINDRVLSYCNITDTINLASVLNKFDIDKLQGLIDYIEESEESNSSDEVFLALLNEYLSVMMLPDYNYTGIILPYSTVRFKIDNNVYTYTIYPDDLSFTDIGIIAETSKAAQTMLRQSVGVTIGLYDIIDVY